MARRMASAGHHVALFGEALEALRRRAAKGRLPDALLSHVRLALARLPETRMGDAFAVTIGLGEATDGKPFEWMLEDAGGSAELSLPARALLHLPGLKRTWSGWLRESVLADLLQRLPRAWVVEPLDMPPHGAIAGLGIAVWEDLWRLRESGRAFRVAWPETGEKVELGADVAPGVWREAAARMAAAQPGRVWMEERPTLPTRWSARYERTAEGRWELAAFAALDQ